MNGDGSGYSGNNGNGNFVTPPDSPGYYYNNQQQNQMMAVGVQQPQQQQQQQPLMADQQQQQAMGYSSPSPAPAMFGFNSPSSHLSADTGEAEVIDTGGISSPALAKALATLSQDKNRRPRSEKKPIPDEQKDDKYFERRRRNNEAAKKSRDSRKQREDELAVRASLLEKSNSVLKVQVMSMREEAMKLRQMWFQKCHNNGMRNAVNGMENHTGMPMQQQNTMQQNPLSAHQGRSS